MGAWGARSPHNPKRNAKRSSEKGEQTVEANHPVDGLPGTPLRAPMRSGNSNGASEKSFLFPPRLNWIGSGREPRLDTICAAHSDLCGNVILNGFSVAGRAGWGRFLRDRQRLGWADSAYALPHRIAKAVRRSIHWMDRPPCLLTSLLGTLCVPVAHCGALPRPPPPLKRRAKLLIF